MIRTLIAFARDALEEELAFGEPWISGIRLFDELSTCQKIALLATVGRALLEENIPSPPLDAVHEATVGMLFETLSRALECEIYDAQFFPDDDITAWRRLVLAAARETDGDDGELPDPRSCNMDDWSLLIEVLDSYVLWDDDWNTPELVMDSSPEEARAVKQSLAISDDYYTAIAPDPTEADLKLARAALLEIAKGAI